MPATVTITLRKPGEYTIRAKGQGNCDGTALVEVRAVGRDLTTSPRSEDSSRAEPRRRQEAPLTPHRTMVTVRATDPWTDTGIRLLEGDAVRLEASGRVTFAPRMTVGPQGAATARAESAPFPLRPAGALIARIGDDSAPIFIGAAGRTFRAERSGLLWLGINDDHHADNSGAFRVHVSDAREDTRAGRRPQAGSRTRGGSAVPSQWDVRVPAVDTWTDTGVMLAAGDILRLEASGVVHLSQNARDTADPAGSRTRLAPRAVFPDRPAGGLIARIGRGQPIYVGARQQTIRVTENGRLFLLPIAQAYTGLRVLHVRASIPPAALAPVAEREIRRLEPNLPLYDIQSMTQALGSGLGFFPVRVGAVVVAAFGLLAFALAIVGLYGVTSYLASQRTHEIGVRIAIGATLQHIVRLVLENGATLVVLGIAAGMVMTFASSRIVDRFLFGVSVYDPLALVSVVPVLGGVTLIACAIPAWRAARVVQTGASLSGANDREHQE